jgi:putative ABC transport system substrate-binding protein
MGVASLALLAGCGRLPGQTQQPAKVARIGILSPGADPARDIFEALRQGLRELGYVEGQNVTLEYRLAAGRVEPLPGLAAELVALPVDVIVTDGTSASHAAKNATSTIPIVMGAVGYPLQAGLVSNLAHPGGNLTGFSIGAGQIRAKGLELLKEAVPSVTRVAVLWNPENAGHALAQWPEVQEAAPRLGLQLRPLEVRGLEDVKTALEAVQEERVDALGGLAAPELLQQRRNIAEFAVQHRLPTVFFETEYVEAGALMAYGVHIPDTFRRAAAYVDRILKGDRPGDLPVEQPMRFEFVINLKTAQTLGLTIPQHVLLQATEVVQ